MNYLVIVLITFLTSFSFAQNLPENSKVFEGFEPVYHAVAKLRTAENLGFIHKLRTSYSWNILKDMGYYIDKVVFVGKTSNINADCQARIYVKRSGSEMNSKWISTYYLKSGKQGHGQFFNGDYCPRK